MNFIICYKLWKLPFLHHHASRFGFAHDCSALHLPFFGGEKTHKPVIHMCWIMLFNEIGGKSSQTYFNSASVSWQNLPSTKLLRASSFWCSLPACWRHQLMPEVLLSFPSCMYYRQRQMETWNCWPQLLDHVSIFRFLQGSCVLQNSSVHVSWYVTLEEGF